MTRDNVNELFQRHGFEGEIGLLSIDAFTRQNGHFSHLYYGCSLRALSGLAARKGYALVGCDSAGHNAFFVRRGLLGALPEKSVEQAFVDSQFRESRDARSNLTYASGDQRRALIEHLPVHDLERDRVVSLGALDGA